MTEETNQTLSKDTTHQIQRDLKRYFKKNPGVGPEELSLDSGVSAQSIKRIVEGDLTHAPAPHVLLNLLASMKKETQLSLLLEEAEGALGESLRFTYGPFLKMDMPHTSSKELNHELKDSLKYFIYKCSANRSGISKEWLKSNFGKLGEERLQTLTNKGFLQGGPDIFHGTKKDFSLDLSIAAHHLPQLVKFYKPFEADFGQNLFYTLSESVNIEAILKIKDIQRNAVEEIYKVLKDPESDGDIPYFTLNLCDSLTLKQREALQ